MLYAAYMAGLQPLTDYQMFSKLFQSRVAESCVEMRNERFLS